MQGRIGLLSTDNNSDSLKGGQPACVCVCQDTFRSSAIRVSCGEQQRPTIKGVLNSGDTACTSVCSSSVYYSPQVICWSRHTHKIQYFVFVQPSDKQQNQLEAIAVVLCNVQKKKNIQT